jgi:hypothetical protein
MSRIPTLPQTSALPRDGFDLPGGPGELGCTQERPGHGNFNVKVRRLFWALAIVLGLLQAWASRFDLVNDTVCYLDIGDHIWRGQWSMAINGVWNPLYAAILGAAVGLFHPSLYWEYPLVHAIVFLIFLLTLSGFDFLLRELIALRREKETVEEFSVPGWVWQTIGYAVFLWSSLHLIGIQETNPDMLVAACFYLACALIVRIHRAAAGWPTYVGLGIALGCGYLTKSIMFPVSLLCLGAAFVCARRRQQLKQACLALCVFLALSLPFVTALSLNRGRFTFGDSGRYNYVVHVNQFPVVHWQGEIPGGGTPIHPTRQIVDRPATFEFDNRFAATYPAWYDPSYWYEGAKMPFGLRRELGVAAKNLLYETAQFSGLGGSLIAGLFIMFYMGDRKWLVLGDISEYWFILLPSVATFGMYALIHWEPRYLAPFFTVVALCVVFSVRLTASIESRRLWSAMALLMFGMLLSPWDWITHDFAEELQEIRRPATWNLNSEQEVTRQMYRLGVLPGDKIASLEFSLIDTMIWARLARVSIIAEVYFWPNHPETFVNDFWKADSGSQQKVIQALAETGAKAVISGRVPTGAVPAGWQQAGNTQYYIYRLPPVNLTPTSE